MAPTAKLYERIILSDLDPLSMIRISNITCTEIGKYLNIDPIEVHDLLQDIEDLKEGGIRIVSLKLVAILISVVDRLENHFDEDGIAAKILRDNLYNYGDRFFAYIEDLVYNRKNRDYEFSVKAILYAIELIYDL